MNNAAALSPFGVKTAGFTVADLTPEACAFLRCHGAVRRYAQGEVVQLRGAPPSQGSWLLEGRLVYLGQQPDGAEQHGGWIMPDELFGLHYILPGLPTRFTVRVDTDTARILHFSREVLLEMMRTVPQAGVGVCVGLSRRLQQQYDMIDIKGSRSLADKLKTLLLWWAKQHGIPARDGSVELWISQNDIANGVGGSRQRVHLELQGLRDAGDIELGYRKLIVRPAFFVRMQQKT